MVNRERIDSFNIKFPILETERVLLREYQVGDGNDYFEIISNPNVTQYLDWGPYESLDECQKIIDALISRLKDNKGINWALWHKGDHKLIGRIGVFWNLSHSSGEMNIEMGEAYWKKGLGSETLEEVCRFLMKDLGFNRLEAKTKVENVATQKLFTKVGFKKEGIMRKSHFWKNSFHDLVLLSLLEADLK